MSQYLAENMIDGTNLQHYGRKGMKKGIRRTKEEIERAASSAASTAEGVANGASNLTKNYESARRDALIKKNTRQVLRGNFKGARLNGREHVQVAKKALKKTRGDIKTQIKIAKAKNSVKRFIKR